MSMRNARLVWTALCVAAAAFAFFWLPAWDTVSGEGSALSYDFFSGAELFVATLFLLGVVWLVGLGLIALISDVGVAGARALKRRKGGQ